MKQISVRKVTVDQYHRLREAGFTVRFVQGGRESNTDQELVNNLEMLEALRQNERSLDRQVTIGDLQLSIINEIQGRLE